MIQQLWRVLCSATSLPEYILTVVLILAALVDVEVGTGDERTVQVPRAWFRNPKWQARDLAPSPRRPVRRVSPGPAGWRSHDSELLAKNHSGDVQEDPQNADRNGL